MSDKRKLVATRPAQEVILRDGTTVLVRPIRPDDKGRLQRGLQQLSPRSRYLRFHTPIDHLTDEQLRYLTEVDYRDHMAWVAVDPRHPDEPGIGVARYIRLADDPTVAEAAVTVIDRYQGRGVGTALLHKLADTAVDNGIRTLRNYVLAENRPMLDIVGAAGARRVYEGDGVYRIDVPLYDEHQAPTRTPREILRSVARGLLPPLHWTFPRTAVDRDRTDSA